MTLKEFNSKYHYRLDKDQFGIDEVWEVIEPSSDGLYYGDCESYALTLKYRVEGFEDLELWYCKVGTEGHCVGKLEGLWIDNGTRKLVSSLGVQYHSFKKFQFYTIWVKMLRAKILLWYKGL